MKRSLSILAVACICMNASSAENPAKDIAAPVSGFARVFIYDQPLADATVTVLETGLTLKTHQDGRFGPFYYPVGKPLTLELSKIGYKTTQTATITVPNEGLTGPYNNITFQVASIEMYYLLAAIVGAKIDDNACHVTTTVTKYHKTLEDVPQGEPYANVQLIPFVNEVPFYFDIFDHGPLKGKTNPFTRGLTQTSEDGGVAFFNLPPSDQPYIITASKSGVQFTQAQFICRKGAFINVSPPRGPMVLA